MSSSAIVESKLTSNAPRTVVDAIEPLSVGKLGYL